MLIFPRLIKTDLINFALLTIISVAAVESLHKESSNAQSLSTHRLLATASAFVEKDLRILPTGFIVWLGAVLKKLSEGKGGL